MSLLKTLAVVGGMASTVAAHGHVTGLVVDGVYYEGYNPSFQFETNPPAVIGWTCAECLDNGFVAPDAYADPNIICHKNATPGAAHATVKAGGTIEVQWTAWPSSHHGPVIDYLAKCDGACETVDKTALEFFKIDAGGLVDDSVVPGTWASDQLIANNNSWVLRIPSGLAPGNYVLRHEIIALHSAGNADGAQNYPQCFNLEVTGSGSDAPTGTLGTALYKESDPGILINIYTSLSTYDIPGPTLISGALSASQTPVAATGAATVSSIAAVTSSPAAVVPPSSSSSAAASSSSGPPAVTSTSSVAPTSPSSSASPSATPTPIPVAVLSSAVASASASDPTFSSALPTVLSTGAATSSGASTKPLPAGVTLADVLAWLEALLGPVLKTDGKRVDRVKVVEAEQRKHARQFG